jgi:CRISPR-associated endonuclease/helicase Cas3
MNYLKALGVLRLVSEHEQADREARGCWCNDAFVVHSTLDRNVLTTFFLNDYRPTPVVGQWVFCIISIIFDETWKWETCKKIRLRTMSDPGFDEVFRAATGSLQPYPYQCRLACGPDAGLENNDSLRRGTPCRSQLINIPTGLGKTAAVVLAWLWNRILCPEQTHRNTWPRRLVYCLPMRTLVEQTRDNVRLWIQRLQASFGGHDRVDSGGLRWLSAHSPVILMGGEDYGEWDLHPEREAILIGTQDMLLSRALNRGYGMSRYRWPMHFGLLNNDCLWIYDEVQLMGSGVPTTAQLESFRRTMNPALNCYSFWMSATLKGDWLKTVDFEPQDLGEPIELAASDLKYADVRERHEARKLSSPAKHSTHAIKELAQEVFDAARAADGLTLVVVNTVQRAFELYHEIARLIRGEAAELSPVLIHSRFRPGDRKRRLSELLIRCGRKGIVVSTQVVEAGVDVSAQVLFSEIAPWTSLVQRFGRCNRRGEFADSARIYWIDLNEEKLSSPYEPDRLREAGQRLRELGNASPATLAEFKLGESDKPRATHVIRRKDLVELFDTTADLAGNDIDIDRFVRETDQSSVQVFWRDWPDAGEKRPPEPEMARARRDELCPAPIREFRDFLKSRRAWNRDYLERRWQPVDREQIIPGQIYLLSASAGGYSVLTGWNSRSAERVSPISPAPQEPEPPEHNEADYQSQLAIWQSMAEHTDAVCGELSKIIDKLDAPQREVLLLAARWHDRGKAHEIFQDAVKLENNGSPRPGSWPNRRDVAKAPKGWWTSYDRKHFRHELASALAILHPESGVRFEELDLIAYLAASHHGKVRLSIRSLPEEKRPNDGQRFARGIWDADLLPAVDLGETTAPAVSLSLELMELGLCEQPPFENQPSWAERMLRLRDRLGPFRLAFLETLLRCADERASVTP